MGKSDNRESRALSAARALWQSPAAGASWLDMTRVASLLAPILATALAAPALAVPGGEIGTLPIGSYHCELPDDATGIARTRVPEEDFEIVSASSYIADGVRGTYLLTGDHILMTSGPYKGKRFHRIYTGFVRRIGEDGQDTPLRCVLVGRPHG